MHPGHASGYASFPIIEEMTTDRADLIKPICETTKDTPVFSSRGRHVGAKIGNQGLYVTPEGRRAYTAPVRPSREVIGHLRLQGDRRTGSESISGRHEPRRDSVVRSDLGTIGRILELQFKCLPEEGNLIMLSRPSSPPWITRRPYGKWRENSFVTTDSSGGT